MVVLTAAPSNDEKKMLEAIQARQRPAFSLSGQLSLKELAALTQAGRSSASIRRRCISRRRSARRPWRCSGRPATSSGGRGACPAGRHQHHASVPALRPRRLRRRQGQRLPDGHRRRGGQAAQELLLA